MPDQQYSHVTTRLKGGPTASRTTDRSEQGQLGNAEVAARLAAGENRAQVFDEFMAQERDEGSNGWHMSFLDRGLSASQYADQIGDIPGRLRGDLEGGLFDGPTLPESEPMPKRGELPKTVTDLDFLHEDIQHASIAVGAMQDGELQTRWYGREDRANDQFWSATKQVQALSLVSLLNSKRPDLDIDDLQIREAGKEGTGMPLSDLLQDIVSYDEGIERSNAGAVTLARFRLTNEREQFVEQQTGNDLQFMGGYGFRPMYDQPEIVTCSGEIVATAPAHSGQVGPNHTSAYDLTRIMAMATWHTHLEQDQRLPGAQWHSIESVMRAMGEDSARYVDAAIEKLGVEDILGDVVVATKLGHGIRDATKNAETVYSGMLQFNDLRESPAPRRTVNFTLRGVHPDPVTLDARMAAEVTEVLRRVLAGQL